MIEMEKKFYRKEADALLTQKDEEIKFLKKRIDNIDNDRSNIEEKYTLIAVGHATCEHVKKENQIKIEKLEKEIADLKEYLNELRGQKTRTLTIKEPASSITSISNQNAMSQATSPNNQESSR